MSLQVQLGVSWHLSLSLLDFLPLEVLGTRQIFRQSVGTYRYCE
ncbi:hypothetical protein [Nostoc sp.]